MSASLTRSTATTSSHEHIIREILVSRGYDTTETRQAFLSPAYDDYKHDPFLLPDMDKAVEIINENEDIGAILLECSDMPPYAYAIQSETQLPVFDFITLIKFLHTSVTQAPYCGWI